MSVGSDLRESLISVSDVGFDMEEYLTSDFEALTRAHARFEKDLLAQIHKADTFYQLVSHHQFIHSRYLRVSNPVADVSLVAGRV